MFNIIRDSVGIPNTFLLSPPRTATTSLANWLSQHPNICVSNKKEPLYLRTEYQKGTAYYSYTYFRHYAGEKIIVDMAPGNFGAMFTAERMFETNPNAKFITVVRERWERAYSEYLMYKSLRPGRVRSFEEELMLELKNRDKYNFKYEPDYVNHIDSNGITYNRALIHNSCYGDKIKHWNHWFDERRFWITNFKNIEKSLKNLFLFLGITTSVDISIKKENTVATPDYDIHEVMSDLDCHVLNEINYIFKNDRTLLINILETFDDIF